MLAWLYVQLCAPHRVPRRHRPPAGDVWSLVEAYAPVIVPLLSIAVLTLVVYGIRRGLSTNVEALREEQREKDSIVRMMRAKLLVTADDVSRELHVDRFRAAALLDALVREGKLVEQKLSGGVLNYRLKGL